MARADEPMIERDPGHTLATHGVQEVGNTSASRAVLQQLEEVQHGGEVLDLAAFVGERIEIGTEVKGNWRKQIAGKTLGYDTCGNVDKKKLDDSRSVEWKKWLDFGASVKIQGQVLHELLGEGHKPIPTQWIDTDKNEHLELNIKPI